jgi:hypothetical protein
LDFHLRQHALLDALLVGFGEVDVLDLHADAPKVTVAGTRQLCREWVWAADGNS